MTVIVRYPDNQVLAKLLALGKQMHEDSRYAHLPFCHTAVTQKFATAVTLPEWYYLAAAVKDGVVVGGMLGRVEQVWFARPGVVVATDLALYVDKSRRGGMAAAMLIKDFRQWAVERNATDVVVGSTADTDIERAAGLYGCLGFDLLGVVARQHLQEV